MGKTQPSKPVQEGEEQELFKHTPVPDPTQAVESGDPTLTGAPGEKLDPEDKFVEPEEGAHWESGWHQPG